MPEPAHARHSGQAERVITGMFDRRPGRFQKQTLLGIGHLRLDPAHAEKRSVEAVRILHQPTAPEVFRIVHRLSGRDVLPTQRIDRLTGREIFQNVAASSAPGKRPAMPMTAMPSRVESGAVGSVFTGSSSWEETKTSSSLHGGAGHGRTVLSRGRVDTGRRRPADMGRERGDGGKLEEIGRREREVEFVAQLRQHPQGKQTVATGIEKAILDADIAPKRLEPDTVDALFQVVPRRNRRTQSLPRTAVTARFGAARGQGRQRGHFTHAEAGRGR